MQARCHWLARNRSDQSPHSSPVNSNTTRTYYQRKNCPDNFFSDEQCNTGRGINAFSLTCKHITKLIATRDNIKMAS